jgi:hypothetical protein
MYHSFKITNFRCFRELEIPTLERVNLITGMNNVGKTALLEALFVHIGRNNPELTTRITGFRGIERFALAPEEIWGWLFCEKNVEQAIELSAVDDKNVGRNLTIRLVAPREPEQLPLSDAEGKIAVSTKTTAAALRQLELVYHDSVGESGTSRAVITPEGPKMIRAQFAPFPLGAFLSTRHRFPQEDADRFSSLERIRRQDEVLKILQILEPRLRRLSVLITGGVPMVNADLGIGELVPIPIAGEGMGRLLSMVLSILSMKSGFVLVDEFENGLHHSVMSKVWKAVGRATREVDVQLFATTHSWECVRAAHEAFDTDDTYDFMLHRLDRVEDKVSVMSYDRETLAAAFKNDLEVR